MVTISKPAGAPPRPPVAPAKYLDLDLSEEERDVLELAHEVCRREIVPIRAELDEHEAFPEAVFAKLREIGLFRAMFDVEHGGVGLRRFMQVLINEILGEYCLGVATSFGSSAVLGPGPVYFGGTEEQKQRVLPRVASGEWITAFAFTEPEAGSDAFNLRTTAVRKGSRWVLNGTKQWITNAGRADVYSVFALTGSRSVDPRAAISCFLVEKGTPGLSFGKLERKLGVRCSHTRQLILEEVEVPEENLVGLRPNQGFVQALWSLTRSRVSLAASAVGLAHGAYKEALKYAVHRQQFGKKIIHHQALQHMLVDMLVKVESARLLTYKAAHYVATSHPDAPTWSAMAKYQAAETAMQVATDALQAHGGYGFSKDYPIEKMFRDAKILAIYEGTSQMMKNQIGGHLLKEAAKLR
ncbi:MAG TPA: acyl-CoA dehydrogenase family protein [Thermoanaerobaculia bacterium]|nr:acyl-CoA dehydrogenase family protein [Thermoanaerobaculia bacterium]